MKLSTILTIAALAVGLSSFGAGQVNAAPNGVGAVVAQTRHQHKAAKNPDIKLMRSAAKECHQAVVLMKGALPIYHGDRVAAMKLTRLGVQEIRLGIKWNKTMGNAPKISDQIRAVKGKERNKASKYSNDQIAQSNKAMSDAAALLGKAISDLQAAKPDFGGHRANAIEAINKALADINLALGGTSVHP